MPDDRYMINPLGAFPYSEAIRLQLHLSIGPFSDSPDKNFIFTKRSSDRLF